MSNWKRKLKRHVLDEPPRAMIADERHVAPRPSFSWPEARTNLERGRAVHQALETMFQQKETAT